MSSSTDTSTGAAAMAPATLDALAAHGQHEGWRVLDTARAQQFTGEIVFQTQPSVSVYLDDGHAYYAVRTGDPSLCERLIDADVIAPTQLARGVIRVGNVENLGRLFDRDPSVDRDAVMVILELATDDVMTTVANTVTSSITLTAYRHHASGVHRWFVAPSDQRHHVPAQLAPVGEVAQIDASVTSDLPGLAGLPDDFDDGVQIEWDQPLGNDLLDEPVPLQAFDESMLQSILETRSAPAVPADDPRLDAPDVSATVADEVVDPDLTPHSDQSADHFQIVWPDGSEQALVGSNTDIAATTPESIVDDPSVVVPAEDAVPPASDPALTTFSFELPPLVVADDNLPDDHQPEEVVDAVRRALEAIESASAAPTRLASVAIADLPLFVPTTAPQFEVVDPFVVTPRPVEAIAAVVEPIAEPVAEIVAVIPVVSALEQVLAPEPVAKAAPAGFAPPTMDDSAEAVYARAAQDAVSAGPAVGVASVVFVDEDPDDNHNDRTGALKRLIGSLRRK